MITARRLTPKDKALFTQLIAMFNKVFEEKAKKASAVQLSKLLSNPHFIAVVAVDGKKVVGGLTAYEMPQYTGNHSEVYLYDMAVLETYQRKSIGKKLVQFLKSYCRQHKIPLFFVEAHELDKHAVNFYKTTGGKPEKVVHFNFSVK